MRVAFLGLVVGTLLIAGLAVTPASSARQTPQTPPAPTTPPPAVAQPPATPPPAAKPEAEVADTFDSKRAIEEVQKAIAGKEEQPAETVFRNIQSLKGVPAGRLPRVMGAFTQALGVTCKECHDVENWASDAKHEKKTARGMMAMVRDINDKYLKTMPGLEEEKERVPVNCTTCHRGQPKPTVSLGAPRSGGR